MEKFPNNTEKTQNDQYRKIGKIGVLYYNANAKNVETYYKNINPYLEQNREEHAKMYFTLCLNRFNNNNDCYDYISTFGADKETAQYIMGPINEMYKQVKIKRDIIKGSDKDFFCKYSQDDNTLHLCYGEDYDYDRERIDSHDYYGNLQLGDKYRHFYIIASEVWKAHKINEPDKYQSFSKKELAEEADLYATHILIDGMEKEREYWQGQIRADVYPSPAERLFNIEKLLRKLKDSHE